MAAVLTTEAAMNTYEKVVVVADLDLVNVFIVRIVRVVSSQEHANGASSCKYGE